MFWHSCSFLFNNQIHLIWTHSRTWIWSTRRNSPHQSSLSGFHQRDISEHRLNVTLATVTVTAFSSYLLFHIQSHHTVRSIHIIINVWQSWNGCFSNGAGLSDKWLGEWKCRRYRWTCFESGLFFWDFMLKLQKKKKNVLIWLWNSPVSQ